MRTPFPSPIQEAIARVRREVAAAQARAQRRHGRPATLLAIGTAVFNALTRERRYQLTLEGALFTAITFAVGFAAMNTMVQLLYLLFALMSGLLIVSSLLATRNLRALSLERRLPALAEAQRPCPVLIRAENGKRRLASASLRVGDETDDRTPVGAVFFDQVPPRSHAEETYDCLFPRRGVYRFGRLRVATRWPFGLIERSFVVEAPAEVLVLPALVDVSEVLREAARDFGEQDVHRKGRGTGLHNIREHVPGDPSRDIHWKVSARRGVLMVREHETEERRRIAIVLDNRAADPGDSDVRLDFERAVVLAASAAHALLQQGWEVELLTASGRIGFDSGEAHSLRIRRTLAMITLDDAARHRGPGASSDPHAPLLVIGWAGAGPASGAVASLTTSACSALLTDALRGLSSVERPAA